MLELQSVTYEIESRVIVRDVTFSFLPKKYGLVGANGVGKTTLAQLLSGRLEPTSGRVLRSAAVAYLAQHEPRSRGTVGEVLVDVWSRSSLYSDLIADLVSPLDERRNLTELSGGEWMRLRLARALGSSPEFLILDEPTNDLDREGRNVALRLLRGFPGGILAISHDRELLRGVDEILELKPSGLTRYGGAFDFYWQERAAARERQQNALDRARGEKRAADRERQEKLQRQERRMRAGARRAATGGVPRIVAGGMKRRAQATAGKLKQQADRVVEEAAEDVSEALEALESDPFMRLDFESEAPPASRLFFEARDLNLCFDGAEGPLWPRGLSFLMRGRERWHVQGSNGSGKSTLLRLLLGEQLETISGTLWAADRPMVYLDQSLSLLRTDLSVLENIRDGSRFPLAQLRNELAFYGFKGDSVHQRVGTLSGGERLRAALASCFLGAAIPQVILLDEPTNNLDFQSLDLLEAALSKYRGLMVLVSHDSAFVDDVVVTNQLVLPERG
jgi:ATPase subunit of ABC transporter with duplicated ATPase domains